MNPKSLDTPRRPNAREKLLDAAFDLVYIHGYAATSVDIILKVAGVPKGSLYHNFGSKKALVTAMIRERLFPLMDRFFSFRRKEGCGVTESIRDLYAAMARNRPLITYGCPFYRLMVEFSPVDGEFDALLLTKDRQLHADLAALLREGIERAEYSDELNPERFAATMLSATWGCSPSPRRFRVRKTSWLRCAFCLRSWKSIVSRYCRTFGTARHGVVLLVRGQTIGSGSSTMRR